MLWAWLGILSLAVTLPLRSEEPPANTKPIRLRTGIITTPLKRAAAPAATGTTPAEATATGLWLVQFNGRFQTEYRAPLAALGAEPLHYIPDDTFITRLQDTELAALRALPFVRWVGPYEARYKIDPRLNQRLAVAPGAPLPVRVLLRPQVSGFERVLVNRQLRSATPLHATHLGTVTSGQIDGRRLFELAKSPAIIWIEPAAHMRLFDAVATKILMGEGETAGSMAELHDLGFDGRGVTVAVADSGLDSGDVEILHPDIDGRVDALFAYGGLADASDEHGHGTHCAGIVAGDGATGEADDDGELFGLGVAPGAHLVGQRIFDGNGDYFPPASYEQLTRDAVRSGAYVGSNSWGDDTSGQYDLSAAEFDALVRDADALTPGEQPYILEFSAGNAGPGEQTIGSPAVAKNVIATGACQNNRFNLVLYAEGQEVMADFSSRGPCEDGRIKPDVVAPGTWIASLRSIFANDNNSWSPISDHYLYEGGTSQAGPHASGAAAVLVQWYRQTHAGQTPSPALVKAGLINSADDMGTATIPDPGDGSFAGGVSSAAKKASLSSQPKPQADGDPTSGIVVGDTAPVPNGDEGWGRINLVNLINGDRRFDLLDQGPELHTAQSWEKRVVVGADDQLKVTLVYTDVPALPAAIPALVNDLDLEVVAPDGSLYRGNAFSEGESVAGTPEGDRINNVEAVHLSLPTAGEWLVRVRAHNVVADVHHRTNAAPQQDFALVISGALPLPGEGVISFDRPGYRAPGTATVRLTDFDLGARTNVTVRVASSREPGGFDLLLSRVPGGSSGSFVGTVNLDIGATNTVDQILQVADGDELTVTYLDASPAGERHASALVDLTAPTVANVQSKATFGRVTITWLTGEAATGTVIYGITNAVTNIVNTVGLAVAHQVVLPALEADTLYYFYVISADAAGNVTTNTLPGGVYYRFTPPPPKTALLVYSPESLLNEFADQPYPGRETWTGPLDALGINYEIWDTSENNGLAPTLDELSQYRLVLWRPEELSSPAPGLTTALNRYVAGGGSLFVASYDLISRLTQPADLTFRTNVLHLASFDEDQGATAIKAIAGDPVGGTLNFALDYSEFPSGLLIDLLGIVWEDGPDHLRLQPDAAASLTQEDGRIVGLRYPRTGADSKGRVVFWSFAFEAIPATGDGDNNRTEALAQAVAFLLPDLQAGASVAFDQSAYTVPANVVVEVVDARRTAQATVNLALKVGTAPEQTLTLSATPQKGVFRGRATLIAPPAPGSAGRFPAVHGNSVGATYLDAANRTLTVTVPVDTIGPVISGIDSDPAYNEATLIWETDKPADALVRYGESGGDDSFLTKTSYNAELATHHEVQIRGLLPDKTYYFEVVSRDAAGNVSRDNANGKYHTVRTLTPLKPPVRDDLEHGREGYVVFNDSGGTGSIIGDEGDGSDLAQVGWQFGVAENAHGVTAHSGTNCWGTNLKGEFTDFAISDLITPAISLVGGNQATLRFWQAYDFTQTDSGGDDSFGGGDLVQTAQVAVSTDNGAAWTTIYTPEAESSGGWEEVTVDLSRFVGSTVRFRFNYQLFSFNTTDRLGWLIDDLAVDLNVVASSRVVVSNNLSQASFLLTSTAATAGGNGRLWSTNVPPGDYVIHWLDVPYYLTPAPQTNHLGDSTNALVFVGTYLFPDANRNGLSDLWETRFFGGPSPFPGSADHDGDGVSDLREFYAGTNPTNAASALRVSLPQELPNRTVRLTWPSQVGREYVLEGSQDLVFWTPYSDPITGIGGIKSVILPALDARIPYFFRVSVRP